MAGPAPPVRKKTRGEDSVATLLKGLHVRELTINELWNVLREKGIY
jgi:hypothetical protein